MAEVIKTTKNTDQWADYATYPRESQYDSQEQNEARSKELEAKIAAFRRKHKIGSLTLENVAA